jgi:cell division protein FtsW (lipid II flippase)
MKSGVLDLLQAKFLPVNVGIQGGDLPTRYFAAGVMAALTIVASPPLGVAESTLKIFALLAAMCGTMMLMAGLVFSQKTHYAGIVLIPAPFVIFWLAKLDWEWIAVGVGMIVIAAIAQNLVTKRCGVNRLLGISSASASQVCE